MKKLSGFVLFFLMCAALPPLALAQDKQDFSNIKNFLRINDKICTGGQPSLEDLARLKADGVKAVINFRLASEMNVEEESAKAKELGLRYFHIPFDNDHPKADAADEFLRVMSDAANRPIFIHCTTANRVGAFWMIYRVLKDGWKVEEAEEEAKKVGLRNAATRDFAMEYIRTHEKKPVPK
ncbi:MAG: protein tyrosine phosphatase family protein [Acidobacteria bacterium]|nr:protein tyrosine phosphatase family protein [Acidobacteriota bacterium]MCL5289174.1 protein tyrosine phosphatase family protein [Acidobacteriota bacterium]